MEIDRERTSAEASQAFGKMVLHFLRDRTLLKEQNEGRHVARCMSCDWIAMEETAEPRCPICQSRLIPHESLPTHQQ
jgi:rubrerythrin